MFLNSHFFVSQNTSMNWDVDSELWEKLLLWHKNAINFFYPVAETSLHKTAMVTPSQSQFPYSSLNEDN